MASADDYKRVDLVDYSRGPAPREAAEQFGPYPGSELVPTEGAPKEWQVSTNKASTPDAMATETDDSQSAFAELQQFLNNNLETPGSRICHPQSKPWTPPQGAEGE